jgi:hypothetical protein
MKQDIVKFSDLEILQSFMRQGLEQLGYFVKIPLDRDRFGLYNAYQMTNTKNTIFIEPTTLVIIEKTS